MRAEYLIVNNAEVFLLYPSTISCWLPNKRNFKWVFQISREFVKYLNRVFKYAFPMNLKMQKHSLEQLLVVCCIQNVICYGLVYTHQSIDTFLHIHLLLDASLHCKEDIEVVEVQQKRKSQKIHEFLAFKMPLKLSRWVCALNHHLILE